jgi:predicted RNA-binding Zn ribbon-like protein
MTMTGERPAPATSDQPAQRAPAPGSLLLLQAFLNSADLEAGEDAFASLAGARKWLRTWRRGARTAGFREADRRQVVEFREALRDLIEARPGGAVPRTNLARFRSASAAAGLSVAITPSGEAVLASTGSGAAAVIGELLAILVRADADGSARRLKICRRDVCRWAFYDVSRNRSGIWCAMSICGNRFKAESYRRRRASGRPLKRVGELRRRRPRRSTGRAGR